MSSATSSLSFTITSTKWTGLIDGSAPQKETGGIQILNLITPLQPTALTLPAFPAELTQKYRAIQLLRSIQQETDVNRARLEEIMTQLSDIEKVEHLPSFCALVKELATGSYNSLAIDKYLSWSLKLTLTRLRGHSPLDARVNSLYQRIMQGDYTIAPRSEDDKGHSPAYNLCDKTTNLPFAILKESSPEYFSSYSQHLPEMAVTAPVWEHELIGYEQDQVLGLDHSPAALGVSFLNADQKRVRGTIQEFIPNTCNGGSYYNEAGADLLLTIPKSEVHLVALSGMIKGLSAGHMTNYIMQTPQDKPEDSRIYEIDLEEMLLPFNRVSDKEKMNGLAELDEQIAKLQDDGGANSAAIAELEEEKMMMRRSLIVGRLWILGLPQSDLPFDRASLLLLANSPLSDLLEEYQHDASHYSSISEASWQAQRERVERPCRPACR